MKIKRLSRARVSVQPKALGVCQPASVAKAAGALAGFIQARPRLAIVLGSGFHGVGHAVEIEREISYEGIPGFPKPTVAGHAGTLIAGRAASIPVLLLNGRAHFYEGHDMAAVTFAVRTLSALGISDLLLTNAAGGINPRFRCGDFMLLTDHINLMGASPLRGWMAEGLSRFVDLTNTYDPGLRQLLQQAAKRCRLKLRGGVYLAVSGPNYETPAEIRAFRRLGADAVGMSTVPEAIVARQCGMRVAALSCITNLAAGLQQHPLSHVEVLETAQQAGNQGAKLITAFAELYARRSQE